MEEREYLGVERGIERIVGEERETNRTNRMREGCLNGEKKK